MQNPSSEIHQNTSQIDAILEQLYLVQRELEHYFLKSKDLEDQLENAKLAEAACSEILSQNQQLLLFLFLALFRPRNQQLILEISTLKKENEELRVSTNCCHAELNSVSQALQVASLDRDSAQAQCNDLKKSLDEFLQKEYAPKAEVRGHRIESKLRETDTKYMPAGSNMQALVEDPFKHLMLLKNEVLYFIGNSRVTSTLDSRRVKRLIALLGEDVVRNRILP